MTLAEVRPKIKALEAMPTVPAIVMPLTALLQQPPENVKMERVVELVSYDSTIAAQCLRMANSPLFGRRRTETIRSAILALGLKRVQAILLGCCLNRIIPPEKWACDPTVFWRHSMGCAMVSAKIAKIIKYPDPEKAYLAGLLHDLGILVNSLACSAEFQKCLRAATDAQIPLDVAEKEHLGFTHCQSGKILAEQWTFSPDVIEVIEYHHNVDRAPDHRPLVPLIHLSDLLCRLRNLGYGYYEAMAVDLSRDPAWAILAEQCPALAKMDLARLTMDIDGAMEDITTVVDAVFSPGRSATAT